MVSETKMELVFFPININDMDDGFFFQTILRQEVTEDKRVVFDLTQQFKAPPAEPKLIFHTGRCGSTAMVQCLKTQAVVISEPSIINRILIDIPPNLASQALRLYVAELKKALDEEPVIKLTSWALLKTHVFKTAFPNAKIVALQRDLLEAAASFLAGPPGWTREWLDRWIPGDGFADEEQLLKLSELLRGFRSSVQMLASEGAFILDYSQFGPDSISLAAQALGFDAGPENIEMYALELAMDSKDATRTKFFQRQTKPLPANIESAF